MQRTIYFYLLAVALTLPLAACRHDDGLGRVQVRGKVTYDGQPVSRGLITFRPARGTKGPAAGTGIVDGSFLITADRGPTPGPHDIEVKVLHSEKNAAPAPAADSPAMRRGENSVKTFVEHIGVKNGPNDLNLAFPHDQPPAETSPPKK